MAENRKKGTFRVNNNLLAFWKLAENNIEYVINKIKEFNKYSLRITSAGLEYGGN